MGREGGVPAAFGVVLLLVAGPAWGTSVPTGEFVGAGGATSVACASIAAGKAVVDPAADRVSFSAVDPCALVVGRGPLVEHTFAYSDDCSFPGIFDDLECHDATGASLYIFEADYAEVPGLPYFQVGYLEPAPGPLGSDYIKVILLARQVGGASP